MSKILIISTNPFDYDGMTSVIFNNYEYLDKKAFDIDFLAPKNNVLDLEKRIKENNGELFIIMRNMKNIFKYMFKLNAIIGKGKYDIVHVHGNSRIIIIELLIAKINKVKLKIAHSHNSFSKHKIIHKILKVFFKLFYDIPLACSQSAGVWMYGNNTNFKIFNNSIDLNKFKYNLNDRSILKKQYNIDNNVFVIGHVGAYTNQKNHHFILELAIEIKKKKLPYLILFIGDGPNKNTILDYCQSNSLENHIKFIGKTNEIFKYYSLFDVFILPSLFEGFPVTLIEAQASGLECIVSKNVTKEVNICGNINYLNIDSKDVWIDALQKVKVHNRDVISSQNILLLSKSGFDAEKNIENLNSIYHI